MRRSEARPKLGLRVVVINGNETSPSVVTLTQRYKCIWRAAIECCARRPATFQRIPLPDSLSYDTRKSARMSPCHIPRRRHRHRHPREDPREEIACVGRKIVAVFCESVSVSVSASWNSSFKLPYETVIKRFNKNKTKTVAQILSE